MISPGPSATVAALLPQDFGVRICVRDIEESTKELVFEEPTSELNPLFEQGPVHDYEFASPGAVRVRCYRAGQELFFSGEVVSRVVGRCARCVESYEFEMATPFSFVLVPRIGDRTAEELEAEDADLGLYEGEDIDLSPMVRERILVALPTLPLCGERCQGLCPRCGVNLNVSSCECVTDRGDPRWAILRKLKPKR